MLIATCAWEGSVRLSGFQPKFRPQQLILQVIHAWQRGIPSPALRRIYRTMKASSSLYHLLNPPTLLENPLSSPFHSPTHVRQTRCPPSHPPTTAHINAALTPSAQLPWQNHQPRLVPNLPKCPFHSPTPTRAMEGQQRIRFVEED